MPEYIEKSVVINALIDVENRAQGNYQKSGESLYRDLCDTEIRLGKIPAADVEPVVHARWVRVPVPLRKGKYALECSHCKQRLKPLNGKLIYCPLCGAKMDLEESQ